MNLMTIVILKWMKLDNVDEIKIYLGMPSHSTPFSWRSYDGYTFTNSYPSFQHHYHPSSSSSSSQNKTNMKSTKMYLSQHPPNVQNANLHAKNYGCDDSSWLSPCHDDITIGVTQYMTINFTYKNPF